MIAVAAPGTLSCGKRREAFTTPSNLNKAKGDTYKTAKPRAKQVAISEVLEEISALSAPTGIDPAAFEQIRGELIRRLSERESGGSVEAEPIILTNPTFSELTISASQAVSANGDIVVSNLDTSIARIFAKSYEPDENA